MTSHHFFTSRVQRFFAGSVMLLFLLIMTIGCGAGLIHQTTIQDYQATTFDDAKNELNSLFYKGTTSIGFYFCRAAALTIIADGFQIADDQENKKTVCNWNIGDPFVDDWGVAALDNRYSVRLKGCNAEVWFEKKESAIRFSQLLYTIKHLATEHKRSQINQVMQLPVPKDNTNESKPTPAAHASDIDITIPVGKPAGMYDVAVIISNANYSITGTPNVDYALQDAQAMKQYLVKAFGFDQANIIYIENATLAKMYEVFGTDKDYRGKLYKWVKPTQSRIFIYYVGHGAPDQQTGEGYFVPVDANPQYISSSGYKLSTFYENISKIPAVKKTVVIDACFSGSSANGQLIKGVSGLTARLKSEPKASVAADLLLTSTGMNQVSSWYPEKGHSLFTYFFLKGIQGDADINKDGHITMGEMKLYINENVPYMARRLTGNEQQPVMIGKDGDDLVHFVR